MPRALSPPMEVNIEEGLWLGLMEPLLLRGGWGRHSGASLSYSATKEDG